MPTTNFSTVRVFSLVDWKHENKLRFCEENYFGEFGLNAKFHIINIGSATTITWSLMVKGKTFRQEFPSRLFGLKSFDIDIDMASRSRLNSFGLRIPHQKHSGGMKKRILCLPWIEGSCPCKRGSIEFQWSLPRTKNHHKLE